jgi:hypothetical protein
MKACSDAGRRHRIHKRLVIADRVCAERLTDISIQVDSHRITKRARDTKKSVQNLFLVLLVADSNVREEDLGGGSWAVQTKGHRVITMPLRLVDLAPPAFTAPCRNQIGELWRSQSQRVYRDVSKEIGRFGVHIECGGNEFCQRPYRSVGEVFESAPFQGGKFSRSSAKGGWRRSRSDNTGWSIGQAIPNAGSFHMSPLSSRGS